MLQSRCGGLICLIMFLFSADFVFAVFENREGSHQRHEPQSQAAEAQQAEVKLFDLELVNQDGQTVKFKSEVIGDRVVIMNFIYTTCKTACPIQTVIFAHLQEALGPRLGKEVFLVSITLDPATDVPDRLKAYADKHNARNGWVWLTGNKGNVDQVLLGVGAYSSDIVEHPTMILIGDGRPGNWTRFYGFPKMDNLLEKVDELLARHKETPSL
ncbi:MAG: SCO family protein [Nitrospinales bacterium]